MNIALRNLSFSVKNKTLLQAIDHVFHPGRLTALVGGNGAGKSTLIKLLSGEYKPTTGETHWNGQNAKQMSARTLACQRGVFTQRISMSLNFPVEEVVLMGRYPHFDTTPSIHDRRVVNEVMQKFEIAHLAGQNFQQLSGGEQQRVHLARVFAQVCRNDREPTLLLLDEPLNNLDVRHQFSLLEHLRTYVEAGNMAILVIHDLNLAARFADYLLLLHEGRLIAKGVPEEVITEKNLSHAYQFPVKVYREQGHPHPQIQFGIEPENISTTRLKTLFA
ncbi:MAG: heme ABC transporter ATP-binding protein [Salibacteraceae bacterium]